MNCVRWKIAIAIIYKCVHCLKIKFLKSLFQRIAYPKEPSCLYHYLANKMSYISSHHNSMNHDMYSRNSMKLCNLHKEKITPRSVSKANIKFCSLNAYDASARALARISKRAVRLESLSNAVDACCTFHDGLCPSAMQPQQSSACS